MTEDGAGLGISQRLDWLRGCFGTSPRELDALESDGRIPDIHRRSIPSLELPTTSPNQKIAKVKLRGFVVYILRSYVRIRERRSFHQATRPTNVPSHPSSKPDLADAVILSSTVDAFIINPVAFFIQQ